MTDIPARIMEEVQAVAWRWSFDKGETWNYGPTKPGDFRFGNPDIVEPLFSEAALLAAEQRARKEALEEAAKVAENEPEFEGYPLPHVVEAMIAIGPVGNARSACRATKQSIAAAIRALANEKEG